MKHCAAEILLAILSAALVSPLNAASIGNTIYDPNPNHLWNRLNKTLFERTGPDGKHYGLDQLDILYWAQTTNLLSGASHQSAVAVLDEFNHSHGERLIQDPLKKALLQRDLWALFDWVAMREHWNHATREMELSKRLAIAIQRLELTTNEIASLPDNYALAEKQQLIDLPRGLFSTNGDWVDIGILNVLGLVPAHDLTFGGRSDFAVLFHDADGRAAGLDYLIRLHTIEPMYIPSGDTNIAFTLNRFPEFPTNSQWALVRRMRVIDTNGRIRTTHVVESIQLRTYLGFESKYVQVTNDSGGVREETIQPQRFNEFQMTRPSAEMISLGQNQRGFATIPFSKGFDPFQYSNFGDGKDPNFPSNIPIVLHSCASCHNGPGIYSVNTFTRVFSLEPPPVETTQMVESDGSRGEDASFFSKEERADWGLLNGLWNPKK